MYAASCLDDNTVSTLTGPLETSAVGSGLSLVDSVAGKSHV